MQLISTSICALLLIASTYAAPAAAPAMITARAIAPRSPAPENYVHEGHHLSKVESKVEKSLAKEAATATGAVLASILNAEHTIAAQYTAQEAAASSAHFSKWNSQASVEGSRASAYAAKATKDAAKANSEAAAASSAEARASSAGAAWKGKQASKASVRASHFSAWASKETAKATAASARASWHTSKAVHESSRATHWWPQPTPSTTHSGPPPPPTPYSTHTRPTTTIPGTSSTSSITKSMTMAPNLPYKPAHKRAIDPWVIDHLAGF